MNLPNKITLARIFLIPIMIAVFFIDAIPHNLVIGTGIFALAAFTDFLDGYIARKYNLVTNLGKFLDPIADKVLVVSAFLLLLEGGFMPHIYGSVSVIIIVAREFMVSAFRLIASSNGKVLAADKLGKIKTVFQDLCIPVIMLTPVFSGLTYDIFLYAGYFLLGMSVALTVISGIAYLVRNWDLMKNTD